MKYNKLILSSVTAIGLSGGAFAQAGEIEGNVALATDYVFRGVSQTNEEPAISGGLDYGFENGFYLGTWGSNVDFGGPATAEIDFYGGYAFETAGGSEIDLGYVFYYYSGNTDLNYSELQASISFSDITLGLVYSPDYFGSDSDAFVLNADYSFGFAENWSLDFHVGYTTTDEEGIAAPGDDYVDYSVGLTTSGAGVDWALTFYGTDIDDIDVADDRFVLSVSKSF